MAFTHWLQGKMNARTVARIRRKGGNFMGMNVLIPHTVGRKTAEPRETPVTWVADAEGARLVVASGGADLNRIGAT